MPENMEKPFIDIELHEAKTEDLDQLVKIRIAAMRESLEKIGRFDAARARARLTQDFQTKYTTCLIYKTNIIGFIISKQENEEIVINHLYVLPQFQNRGIGKFVLDKIIEQGKNERRNIKLMALKESRANNFYLNNGFKYLNSIEYDNVYVKEWGECF
jgi:ribosomal protein S18 acetylase RimI-like enzyme